MSANQIPGKPSAPLVGVHSCPKCWRNGGGGHKLATLIELMRAA